MNRNGIHYCLRMKVFVWDFFFLVYVFVECLRSEELELHAVFGHCFMNVLCLGFFIVILVYVYATCVGVLEAGRAGVLSHGMWVLE